MNETGIPIFMALECLETVKMTPTISEYQDDDMIFFMCVCIANSWL